MGVDTKLLINSRYGVGDLTKLIRGFGYRTSSVYNEDHTFLTVWTKPLAISLYVARSNEYGGVDGTILLASYSPVNVELLRRIARVTGGFFQENDANNDWKSYQDPHEGNARFILDHMILTGELTSSTELADKIAVATGYNKKS